MFHEDKKKGKRAEEVTVTQEGSDVYDVKNRSRVREIDFKNLEDTLSGHTLSPFELQVREKLAAAPSALEVLIARAQQKSRNVSVKTRVALLLKKAKLTSTQEAYYKLLYVEGLSAEESGKRLGVSGDTVRRMHYNLIRKFRKVAGRQKAKNSHDPCGESSAAGFSRENFLKKGS